jgi:hypothetical protein
MGQEQPRLRFYHCLEMKEITHNPLCLYSCLLESVRPNTTAYLFIQSDDKVLHSESFEGWDHARKASQVAAGLLQASQDELYQFREGQ